MNKPQSKKERKQLKKQEKIREKEQQLLKKRKDQERQSGIDSGGNQKKVDRKQAQSTKHEVRQNMQKENKKKKNKQNQLVSRRNEDESDNEVVDDDQNQNLDFNNVMEDQENLQFAFLIAEINEKHYQSMKTILQKFSRLTGIISSDWADAIVNNGKAGNVVVADDADEDEDEEDDESDEQEGEDDEDNVCSGVINILPSSHKLTKKLVAKINQAVQNKQPKYYGAKKPSQLLGKSNCSLLICERAINLPPSIVKSMYEILLDDLKQLSASSNEDYLKICGGNILGMSEVEIPKEPKMENLSEENLIFTKFQDYLFLQNSECWWIGEGSPNSLRKAPLHKLYYIISSDKYFEAVAQIHSLLQE